MCGRFKRGSDKQRIADAFAVSAGLDETFFEPEDDLRPQSMQPVIYLNEDGERKIEMMCWAFKLPDRLLFNARSEGIERSKFWADAFLKGRVIVPGDAIYEWQEVSGKTRRQVNGNEPLPNELMAPIHDRISVAELQQVDCPRGWDAVAPLPRSARPARLLLTEGWSRGCLWFRHERKRHRQHGKPKRNGDVERWKVKTASHFSTSPTATG